MRTRTLLSIVGVAVVTAAGGAIAITPAAAATGCRVSYSVASQWNTGFTANVGVTNLGDPLTAWTLGWSFSAGQQVTQGWSATVTQSGAQVSAVNAGWNGALGTNASTSFGFNATWNGSSNPVPASFTLNGTACTGSVGGSPSTSPSPSRSPSVTPTTQAPRNTYTNPLSLHGPDPWLKYYNGFYYLATTTWNSTITMRRSRTLAGLATAADTVIYNLSQHPNACCNMWAPEFHLLNGPNGQRWYLYFTAGQNVSDYLGTQRIHVLESAGLDPMGPYTFKADMLDPTANNTWELDGSILQLNGNLYLLGTYYTGSQPMFIRPLSNPWTASGTRRPLSSPSFSWETVGGAVNEGPEVIQRNGKTFIVYSASHCSTPDYKLGLLTYNGGDPLSSSSWVKSSQPIFQRSDANGVYAPGHNGFFTSPDGTEDWIVYHANSSAGGGCDMNRTTRAQKFTWNADGTPNLGTPVRTGVSLPAPAGEPTP
jgi:GH43 family beta-xylosidase